MDFKLSLLLTNELLKWKTLMPRSKLEFWKTAKCSDPLGKRKRCGRSCMDSTATSHYYSCSVL